MSASILTNILHGPATVSFFQLAEGYTPLILGIPSTKLSMDVLRAHVEISANWALQNISKPMFSRVAPLFLLAPGRRIWVFYRMSKENVPV